MTKFIKKINIIDILVFTYIFSISFLKIGFSIFCYSFTISDILLLIICIIYMLKFFRKKLTIPKTLKSFLILYIFFFIGISFSLINAKYIKHGIIELLPYVYAGIMLFSIFLYISDRRKKGLKNILNGFMASIILIDVLTLISFYSPLLYNIFFIASAAKFTFLTNMPNQLSVFTITGFCVYIINGSSKNKSSKIKILAEVLLCISAIFLQFITQSRTGMSLTIILVIYFIIKKINYKYIYNNLRHSFLFFILFYLTISVLWINIFRYNTESWRRFIFSRPLMPFRECMVIDQFRKKQFLLAINTYKNNPIIGIGLGNFRFTHPEHKYEIHNSFINMLTETGALGFTLFIFLFVYIFYIVTRSRSKRKLDYIILFFTLFILGSYHHIFRERWIWVLLGYAISSLAIYENNVKTIKLIDRNKI